MTTPRDNVLNNIRLALNGTDVKPTRKMVCDASVFRNRNIGLIEEFAKEFGAVDGCFTYCADRGQLLTALRQLIVSRKWQRVLSCSVLLGQYFTPDELGFISEFDSEQRFLESVDVGITDCEFLSARTGTVIMSTSQQSGRAFSVWVPVHIIVASVKQLVYDLGDVFFELEQRYIGNIPSGLYLISGPSRTGDIEKTLVLGVHGPLEVHVFLINE